MPTVPRITLTAADHDVCILFNQIHETKSVYESQQLWIKFLTGFVSMKYIFHKMLTNLGFSGHIHFFYA